MLLAWTAPSPRTCASGAASDGERLLQSDHDVPRVWWVLPLPLPLPLRPSGHCCGGGREPGERACALGDACGDGVPCSILGRRFTLSFLLRLPPCFAATRAARRDDARESAANCAASAAPPPSAAAAASALGDAGEPGEAGPPTRLRRRSGDARFWRPPLKPLRPVSGGVLTGGGGLGLSGRLPRMPCATAASRDRMT